MKRAPSHSNSLIDRFFSPHGNRNRLLPLLVLLVLLGISFIFYFVLKNNQNAQNREALEIASAHFSDNFKQTIERRVLALSRQSLRWQYLGYKEATLDSRKFDASLNIKNYPGLNSIEFIDSKQDFSWKVPATYDEADPETDPELQSAILEASKKATPSEPVVTGWTNAKTKEVGWLIVTPILLVEPHQGWTLGFLDIPDLIATALSTSQQGQLVMEIRQENKVIYRSAEKTSPNGLVTEIKSELHGNQWTLRTWPSTTYRQQLDSHLPLWVLLAGIFNALLFAIITRLLIESRRSATALEEAEAELRLILAAAGNGIIGVDSASLCTFINPAALGMLGHGKDADLEGKPLDVLVRNLDETSTVARTLQKCCSLGEESTISNERFSRLDGTSFPVEFSVRPLYDGEANIKGAVLSFIDSSERQAIESQLREARDKALESTNLKSQFLANMSHEIRTPMNGIIGMTGLLLDTKLTEDQREYAETARGCADALLTLINDILDFSKIEAGKLSFEILDFDLRETVEAVVDLLAETARRKKLELAFYIDPAVPAQLRGDAGRLRQVLLNLMGNALKFTSSGEVSLLVECESVSQEEKAVLRFSIRDTGIGMDSEQQALLFQPFVQADASTTRRFGGTGLGLVISDQLVHMMDGQLGVTSSLGKGSTFWFSATFEKQKGTASDEGTATPVREISGVRILLVDDNSTNRQILTKQVSSWKMDPADAPGGREAVALLNEAEKTDHPFEIAVIDYQMPGEDGLMLATRIKADPVLQHIQLVLLTSMDYRDRLDEIKKAGFSAALLKPVKPSQLYNCLTEVLSKKKPFPGAALQATALQTDSPKFTFAENRLRILMAEDNPINQKVTLSQLKQAGLSADAVGNGREALELVQSVPYNIILMDCQMPEMDGYEATRLIRGWEKESGKQVPIHIIALTANAMEGDKEKCLAAGMNDYVSKPVRSGDLINALQRFVSQESKPHTPAKPMKPEISQDEILDPSSIQQLRDLDEGGTNSLLNELCDTFLADAEERMQNLRSALAEKDMKKVSNIAHALKGGASNFGAKRFTALAQSIQMFNAETPYDQASASVASLENEFALLKEALLKVKS